MNSIKKKKIESLLIPGIIFLIALLFRLFLIKYRFAVAFDEVNYLKLAVSAYKEGLSAVLHTYWSPFYPLVVSFVLHLIPDFEIAGRIVSILAGSIIVFPIYYFAKRYVSTTSAIIASSFAALLPEYAFFSTKAQTEPIYALIAITGVFGGWQMLQKPSLIKAVGIGVLFSWAYLTKPEGIGFLLVFCGILAVLVSYNLIKKNPISKLIVSGFLIIVSFALSAFPYLYYLHSTTGKWTISAKGKANQDFEAVSHGLIDKSFISFRSLNEDNTIVPIDEIYHIGSYLKTDKSSNQNNEFQLNLLILLRKYVENFYKVTAFGMNHALTSPILILMILGLIGISWDKFRLYRELYLISFVVFFWFILIPLFHINDRYFMSVFPIVLIWAAEGLLYLNRWLHNTLENISTLKLNQRKLVAVIIIITLLAGTIYLPQLGKILNRNPYRGEYYLEPIEQKIAGLWIRENATERPIIMSRGHTVDLYAGNYRIEETVTIPRNELSRVLQYARNRGVNYIVLNKRYEKDFPEISYLLTKEDSTITGLEKVYSFDELPELKTVVYRVSKTYDMSNKKEDKIEK